MNQSRQPVNLRAVGGLCNRLRFIFSVRRIIDPIPLRVNWYVNQICPGRFEEVFEDIPGVEMTPHGIPNAWTGSQDFARKFIQDPKQRQAIYNDLVFKPELRLEVARNDLKNTVAFHVRRSDFQTSKLSDERVINLADQVAKGYDYVFLATCDEHVQLMFRRHFGDSLKTNGPFVKPKHPSARETSLRHAALDLLTAKCCRWVVGTRGSSFTDMIFDLRGQKRITLEDLNE